MDYLGKFGFRKTRQENIWTVSISIEILFEQNLSDFFSRKSEENYNPPVPVTT